MCSAFYDLSTYQSEGTRDTVGLADREMISKMKERVKHPSVQAAVPVVCDSSRVERGQTRKRPRRAVASGPSQQSKRQRLSNKAEYDKEYESISESSTECTAAQYRLPKMAVRSSPTSRQLGQLWSSNAQCNNNKSVNALHCNLPISCALPHRESENDNDELTDSQLYDACMQVESMSASHSSNVLSVAQLRAIVVLQLAYHAPTGPC